MKFVDQAVIQVSSGAGGDGCVSFRREKNVPKGGPDGGDGGRGGDVTLVASSQKDTLYRFHLNQHFKAKRGRHGLGANKHGVSGPDLIVELPVGTIVMDADTGARLVDLASPGQQFLVAQGGRGGRGNARFNSSTNRAPRRADPGGEGAFIRLRLELNLLADVGLVGLPNAGKSSLLSRLSAARPKIADYPFTTLIPSLGVVPVGEDDVFVMADIPGIIEGASKGAGLGIRFLKHINRCSVLLLMIDAGDVKPDTPLDDLEKIKNELELFSATLAGKKSTVAVNKMDLTGADSALKAVQKALPETKVFGISAVTGQGLDELKWELIRLRDENLEELDE